MNRRKKTYHLINDYHLLAYELVDSTNEEARRLAEGGGAHGAVIWALEQTAGRGRLGRNWESKPGNLFVSFLLSPDSPIEEAPQLSFVAAVSAIEALSPLLPAKGVFTCKWPNDILLNGKKLGGLLLESFTTGMEEGAPKRWVVIGLGINIDSFPLDARYPATCLKEAGVELVSAKIVLTRFLDHFMANYDGWIKAGFSAARAKWLKHAYCLNKKVDIKMGDELVSGVFEGIADGGEMLVRDYDGVLHTIYSGEVVFSPQKPAPQRK